MSIILEKIDDDEYCLIEDISATSQGYVITALKGLVSDGASIPRPLWLFVGTPFTGDYTRASLIHDAIYQSEALERSQADSIFRDIMYQDGVVWWKRNLMYLAVRIGGYFVWRKHTKNSIETSKKFIRIMK